MNTNDPYRKLRSVQYRTARVMSLLFSEIARHYDAVNSLASLGIDRWWRARAVVVLQRALAQCGVDMHKACIADIACGTGALSVSLARRGAHVIGVDVAQGMLDIARRRVHKLPVEIAERLHFMHGDAHQLTLASQSVDALTICFGLRNMDDRERVFEQCSRVVKSGGMVVCVEFDNPHHPLWRKIVHALSTCTVLCMATVFGQNRKPYYYLLRSIKDWPGAQYIVEQLRQHGFEDVQVIRLGFGLASICVARKRS